jgi:hypothetical protein
MIEACHLCGHTRENHGKVGRGYCLGGHPCGCQRFRTGPDVLCLSWTHESFPRPSAVVPAWLRDAPIAVALPIGEDSRWAYIHRATGCALVEGISSQADAIAILPPVLALFPWETVSWDGEDAHARYGPEGKPLPSSVLKDTEKLVKAYDDLDDLESAAWSARNRAIRKRWQKTGGKYTLAETGNP